MRADLLPKTWGEAVARFVEESGEALKALGKLERFGEKPTDPRTGIKYNNVKDLLQEFDDLEHAMNDLRGRLKNDSYLSVCAAQSRARLHEGWLAYRRC